MRDPARRDVGLGDAEVAEVLGRQVDAAARPVGGHVLDQARDRDRARQIVGERVELGRAIAADVEQQAADRLGGLAGVRAELVERRVAAALEVGAKAGQQLGELGDRQREPIGGIGERDEHGMLGAAAIRVVQLLFPAIELARAAALVRALVGEVVGDAREREQREDVLAQRGAREHRADRIVVVARAARALRSSGSRRRARASAAAGRRGQGERATPRRVIMGTPCWSDACRRARTSRARSGLTSPHADELGGDAIDELAGRAGGARDAARVQRHVTALDAFGRERAQRGEVRREPGGAGDRGEPIGVVDAGELEREPRGGMDVQRAADGADRERHHELAGEAARRPLAPHRERRVRAGARGDTRARRLRPRASPGRSRRARRRRRS